MSISLKSLYDQVQSMKTSGIHVTSYSKGKKGHIFFDNGFQINWNSAQQTSITETFSKAFTNTCNCVTIGTTWTDQQDMNQSVVTSLTKNGFRWVTTLPGLTFHYIAIGYLITNRLLTYAREVMSYGITK